MIVLYIVILIYFNFNITSIVNVFMLSIEKKSMPLIPYTIKLSLIAESLFTLDVDQKNVIRVKER